MFLGHKNELQNAQWKVLPQTNNDKTLIYNNQTYQIQDNICPHQGSRLKQGSGSSTNTICPYHAWSWSISGEPLGSGTVGHSRGSELCVNKYHLQTEPAYEWSGFLFDQPIPIELDIAGDYQLVEYRQDFIKASYIAIMDLFLDIDHIPVVHHGLYSTIEIPTVKEISWKNWKGGSIQYVPVTEGSNDEWAKLSSNKQIEYGAIWLAQYPFTQFEWQPGAVFVQVNQPVNESETVSHVFKYKDLNYSDQSWHTNQEVWETAWAQDKAQAEMLEPGWRYSQEFLEREKIKFRQYLKENQ